MHVWRAIDTGFRGGAVNMAMDEALLRGVAAGTTPSTVRVFGWRPPAVSVGHSQALEKEVDVDACRSLGVDVVRRPTGGRAVLHWGELTYSVVGRSGERELGRTVMETYLSIARALLWGLRSLGVEAELEQASRRVGPRGKGATPPCFASAGRYEILVGGRKVVGSAQRRMGDAVLQHGSMPLDGSHLRIVDLLRVSDGEREELRAGLVEKTADLASILGRAPDFEEVAEALFCGFEREWGVELIHERPTARESTAALGLASGYAVVA